MGWLTIASVVYALLVAMGGIMGYVSAKSVPSLVASGIIALLVLGFAAWSKSNPKLGFGGVAAMAFVMIGVMVARSISAGKVGMPAMGGISLSVLMLILLAVGHFMGPKTDAAQSTPPTQEG